MLGADELVPAGYFVAGVGFYVGSFGFCCGGGGGTGVVGQWDEEANGASAGICTG